MLNYLDDDDVFRTAVHGRQEPILQRFGETAYGTGERAGDFLEDVRYEHFHQILIELVVGLLDENQDGLATRKDVKFSPKGGETGKKKEKEKNKRKDKSHCRHQLFFFFIMFKRVGRSPGQGRLHLTQKK
jgi:hypothetical protein